MVLRHEGSVVYDGIRWHVRAYCEKRRDYLDFVMSRFRGTPELLMPQAKVVIDKFHVVRMANDAMERVRKIYRDSLTPKQRRGLMHDRFVMLKREQDLNDREALLLSGWINNYPELGLAYRLKEDFFKIYDTRSKEEALARFAAWDRAVTHEVRDAFSDLIKVWRNWQPYILNYFEHPVTNAYTESRHSLIRVMNRLGRGYSFEALRAKILFAEGAFKKQIIRTKFERCPESSTQEFAKVQMMTHQHETQAQELNYGPDISTLARMIESGQL